MYTQYLHLESTDQQTYENMERHWNKCRNKNSLGTFGRIRNPIVSVDYYGLFDILVDHPCAFELSVRENATEWLCLRPQEEQVSAHQLDKMAELAENDRKKRNYLVMKFRLPHDNWTTYSEIGFVEKDRFIIGYEVRVLPVHKEMFGLEENFRYFNGLWAPE